MTDKETIQLYASGQRERAFNEIVKNYGERLYFHVRGMVLSHEDADDLMQDIFVKIWAALPSYRGDAQLFTWLWRIATNESLNFLNRRKLRKVLSFGIVDSHIERTRAADEPFDGERAENLLMKAVEKLPARQRTVFMMRYYEELRYEDMAEILGTSAGALKASYHIAYEKIKEELKNTF